MKGNTPRTIFFGTANAHKLDEISRMLGPEFELKSFRDFPSPPEVDETENTLEGNAALKARAFYSFSNLPCFADDTGLEVEALGGSPGVYSARYAGPHGDANANMEKLLAEMQGMENRKARFRTVVAWFDGNELKLFEGILSGTIGSAPQGTGGFGYDPVFIPDGMDKTLAMLTPQEKNAISHRGRAIRKFTDFLQHENQ